MKVRYTANAAAELAAVLDYIAERSPQGAKKVQARIKAAERMLMTFPEVGPRSISKPWLRRISLLPYPYLIFYEVAESRHGVCRSAED